MTKKHKKLQIKELKSGLLQLPFSIQELDTTNLFYLFEEDKESIWASCGQVGTD